jgi:hypothetical protein
LNTTCIDLNEVQRVFKIDCFQKDKITFEKVHYATIFQFKDPEKEEKSTIEGWLTENYWNRGLKERTAIGEFIRPFVIWGATGTGKTELCRWLELNIKHPDYETLRISKRDLAMGGILGIAQKLSSKEIDLGEKLLSKQGGVGAEDAAVYGLGHLIDQGIIDVQRDKKNMVLKALKQIIRSNIEKRVEKIRRADDISKIETTLRFIKTEDLDPLREYYGLDFDIEKINRRIYRTLTNFIASVDDVKRLMFDYVKKKNDEGKIPVLIFDDVTHLGDLVDDFISVITDISGGTKGYICDFIIGTTTDFYVSKFRDRLASTARARIFEIKFSPEEEGEMGHANWLLGEKGINHFLDFVLRYLKAVRICEGCETCGQDLFVEEGNNYFPFSKNFLVNFYRRLLYERGRTRKGITINITPRFVIKILKAVLTKFCETGNPPSMFMDQLLTLDTIDFFVNAEQKKKMPQILVTAWWYGKHTKGYINVDIKTLEQLGLKTMLPMEMQNKSLLKFQVRDVIREKGTTSTTLKPISPDEVHLQTLIRAWCKGEESEVPIGPIKIGFDRVSKCLTSYLIGQNDFNNILNPRSSRKGECISFSVPGGRSYDYWIGEIKLGGPQRIYIMSQYKEPLCKPYINKGFTFIFLDEDDFFHLYKIGDPNTKTDEKTKYILSFLDRQHQKVLDALRRHQLALKYQLEEQLGCSVDQFILSVYACVIDLIRCQNGTPRLKNLDDLTDLSIFDPEKIFQSENWPKDIEFHIKKLNRNLTIIKDLFLSYFTLRGDGSIVDFPLLQQTWSEIMEKGGYLSILKNIGDIENRFFLLKSKKKVSDLVELLTKILERIDAIANIFNKKEVEKELSEIREHLDKVSDLKSLIERLDQLAHKLENRFSWEKEEVENLIRKLNSLGSPNTVKEQIGSLENQLIKISSNMDRISVYLMLDKLRRNPWIQVLKRLSSILNTIEQRLSRTLEVSLEKLQKEVSEYVKLEV